jgi:GR25 family glycosyltransferase involved in LPS biosynthesis
MNLQDFFSKIFCINLDRRLDRWENCLKHFEEKNIQNVIRVSAIDGRLLKLKNIQSNVNVSNLALKLTTINILEDAIKNNLDNFLLLEDDVIFNDNIFDLKKYLDFLPQDWDMVYFGINSTFCKGKYAPLKINENILKLRCGFTTHCVGYNKKSFEFIVDKLKNIDEPNDVIYSNIQKDINVYCFTPMVASQRPDFSDIENKYVDYTSVIL